MLSLKPRSRARLAGSRSAGDVHLLHQRKPERRLGMPKVIVR